MKASEMQRWERENARAVRDWSPPRPWIIWASLVGIVGLGIAPDATVLVLTAVALASVWRALR